ncbi:MAG: hypothetical protein N3C12_14770 [Candidatus Binatia bacterium]|nr:hypothetical protein [Candidatus Binatia bacterium]
MVVAQILAGGGGYVLPLRTAYDSELLLQALQKFLRDRERVVVRVGPTLHEVRRVGPGARCSSCRQLVYGVAWPHGRASLCTRCACGSLAQARRVLARAA